MLSRRALLLGSTTLTVLNSRLAQAAVKGRLKVILGKQPLNAFYVSPTGSDRNSGRTPRTAWQTIAKVSAGVYTAGTHIFFQGGQSFTGTVTLSAAANYSTLAPPTAQRPLVIDSYGTGRATINVTASNVYCLNLNDIHDLVVQNLTLTGTTNTATQSGVGLNNNANTTQYSNITFSNLDISGVALGFDIGSLGGDIAHGFTNVTITGCNVHNLALASSPGIFFGAWTGTNYNITAATYAFKNVIITNTTVSGAGSDGVDFWNINGGLVTNCRITRNGTVASGGGGANAAIEFQASTNCTIQFCEIDHHIFASGASSDGDGINIDRGPQISSLNTTGSTTILALASLCSRVGPSALCQCRGLRFATISPRTTALPAPRPTCLARSSSALPVSSPLPASLSTTTPSTHR